VLPEPTQTGPKKKKKKKKKKAGLATDDNTAHAHFILDT
jgi:hypothetical protein